VLRACRGSEGGIGDHKGAALISLLGDVTMAEFCENCGEELEEDEECEGICKKCKKMDSDEEDEEEFIDPGIT